MFAHPAQALQTQGSPLQLLWSFPSLIKPHQVGFPSPVPSLQAQWGAQAVSPIPGNGSSQAGPAPQPSVPETLQRVKGDGDTRNAEAAAAWTPNLPAGRRSGLLRAWLDIQQQVVPARKREMSSCGFSSLWGELGSPPVLLPASMARGVCHQDRALHLTAGRASLPFPMNSPKLRHCCCPGAGNALWSHGRARGSSSLNMRGDKGHECAFK